MNTIAQISPIFLPATQTFIYDEITGIKKYKVLLLTLRQKNKSQFAFDNIYVAKNAMTSIEEFYQIMKKQNVQLIHFQFGITALFLLGLKKLSKLPTVVTFHGFDASIELKKRSTLLQYKKKLFPQTDHIIAVSHKLKENLVNSGCPENKITVLSNGIDVHRFEYKPRILNHSEPVKILCIARLTEKKGLIYLIEAFSKINTVRPNTELLILGQGELKSELQQRIAKLNLVSKAKIVDYMPHCEIPGIMHKHHIFCLPSVTSSKGDEEGLPTVLKEACATGMPVISTYHSGIPELIHNGKNGFLVPEKNIDILTERLLYLIDHSELWESMGLYGRKQVEQNYNKDVQVRKLEEIYTRLIVSKRPKK